MSTIPLKPGATLTIPGTYTEGSLAGVTIESDMVRSGVRVALTCAVVDAAAGTYTASLTSAQTASLGIGMWDTDVVFYDAQNNVRITHTYHVDVQGGVTLVTG